MANALYTTDNIPSSKLYTELQRSIELTAAERELFRDQFAIRTEKKTVRVTQSAARFVQTGSDMGEAPWDRNPVPRHFAARAQEIRTGRWVHEGGLGTRSLLGRGT